MAETWLVIGLGNPGPRYEATRHNVGQMVLDELAARRSVAFRAHKAGARVAETWLRPGAAKLVLGKPNSFMKRFSFGVKIRLYYFQLKNHFV